MGEPKNVSTSIGRLPKKSWYMTLFDSVGAVIFSIVFSRKPAGS